MCKKAPSQAPNLRHAHDLAPARALPPSREMSVILRGGSMSKARFNGIEATILTLENGAGGWATVCVDGEVVKWRSNSWDWIGGVPQ